MRLLLLVSVLICLLSCASEFAMGTESPKIKDSIIPLRSYWSNRYIYTEYDRDGIGKIYEDTSATWELGLAHKLVGDKLIEMNYYDTIPEDTIVAFPMTWNGSNNGFYISHIQEEDFSDTGIFIIGEFNAGTDNVYDEPKLWLKYLAKTGDTWAYVPDDTLKDTSFFELIDIDAVIIEAGYTNSPLRCYLYKEKIGNKEFLHYYHKDRGMVASVAYENAKRTKSWSRLNYLSSSK